MKACSTNKGSANTLTSFDDGLLIAGNVGISELTFHLSQLATQEGDIGGSIGSHIVSSTDEGEEHTQGREGVDPITEGLGRSFEVLLECDFLSDPIQLSIEGFTGLGEVQVRCFS